MRLKFNPISAFDLASPLSQAQVPRVAVFSGDSPHAVPSRFGSRHSGAARLFVSSYFACSLALAWALQCPAVSGAAEISPEELQIVQQFETFQKTDTDAAERFLKESMKNLRTVHLLHLAAVVAIEKNNVDEAIAIFNEIIQEDATFPHVQKNLGQLYATVEKYAEAVEHLLTGMAQEGIDKSSMRLLSQCYIQMDKFVAAESALRWTLLFDPDNKTSHELLTSVVHQQGRYREAIRMAEQLVRMDSNSLSAWSIIMNSYIALDEYENAITALEAAQLTIPKLPTNLVMTLGELYLRAGMTDEASDTFLALHEDAPLRPDHTQMLLETLVSRGDSANAVKFAELLRQQRPNDAKTKYLCAYTAELNGDDDTARRLGEEALALDSANGKTYLLLGRLLLKKKEYSRATNVLRAGRAFPDQEIDALKLELEMWLDRENWDEALSILEILSQRDRRGNWDGMLTSVLDLAKSSND